MNSDNQPLPFIQPQARIEVEEMNAYQAPLEGRRNLLRLDFNENTIGPSPLVIEALENIPASHISVYPEYKGLQEAFIKNVSDIGLAAPLEPEQIGLFNGVDAAIHSIFHAYGNKGDQLLTTKPTFGYYTPCAHMQGMQVIEIPYEGEHFQFPLEQVHQELIKQKPKLLFICNPNNPTGTKVSAEKILQLAALAPNTLLVIDELYEAFSGESVLPVIDFNVTPNVLLLRSLSKTAGLAGLRIGFAIGHKKIINLIKRVSGPYDINSFAVTAAFAALKDQDYIDNYVAQVLEARDWIKNQLEFSKTIHHIEAGNYFLLWPKREPEEIEACLREEGILVRNMSNKPLIGRSLRVSVGTKVNMQNFWSAFNKHESKID